MPRRCKNNWEMGETLSILEKIDQDIVPTDKNNSFGCMDTKKYMTVVNEYFRC